MTPEKIIKVAENYESILKGLSVPVQRISVSSTFRQCSVEELLMHSHHLVLGIPGYAANPDKYGKANRHLGSVQTILSFGGLLRLQDMMDHNRKSSEDKPLPINTEETDSLGEEILRAKWHFHGFFPLWHIAQGRRACRQGWRNPREPFTDMLAAIRCEDSTGDYVGLERETADGLVSGEGRITIEDMLAEDWYIEAD